MATKLDPTTPDASTSASSSSASAKADAASPFAAWATLDPMQLWTTGQATFGRMMADAMGRAAVLGDHATGVEKQLVERAQGAVDAWAKLGHDAISYGAQLSAEARRLSLETAKKLGWQA